LTFSGLRGGRAKPYNGSMSNAVRVKLGSIVAVIAAGCLHVRAQAPGVPICDLGSQESQYRTELVNAAKEIFDAGEGLRMSAVKKQLKRPTCQLALQEAGAIRLPAREVCVLARRGHVRIGWWHLCAGCGKWHLNLAGGYWLTADGAAATCFHVVEPSTEVKDGCLVALDEAGKIHPVVEVLAANRESDACIVRIEGKGFTPLALNTNTYPGDTVYCFSDPINHREYFSAGIVNRFYQPAKVRRSGSRAAEAVLPTRINVSTDWAPGSSGSAVLDECGNVVGHVSSVSMPNAPAPARAAPKASGASGEPKPKAQTAQPPKLTPIVFHEAVSARDVQRLIKAGK
jgi:hypothetical protein